MDFPREARLRPEFAHLYRFLEPGVWRSAEALADHVIARTLGRPDGRFITGERALDPQHFEFRGSPGPAPDTTRLRREDP
jgi:hypothetical protein